MKKLLIIITFLITICITSLSSAQSLQWDASDDADGYIMYFTNGVDNCNYTIIGRTTVTLEEMNIHPGVEYTYYVVAYNAEGESGPSNTVVYTLEPFIPPTNHLPDALPQPSGAGELRIVED